MKNLNIDYDKIRENATNDLVDSQLIKTIDSKLDNENRTKIHQEEMLIGILL